MAKKLAKAAWGEHKSDLSKGAATDMKLLKKQKQYKEQLQTVKILMIGVGSYIEHCNSESGRDTVKRGACGISSEQLEIFTYVFCFPMINEDFFKLYENSSTYLFRRCSESLACLKILEQLEALGKQALQFYGKNRLIASCTDWIVSKRHGIGKC